jgi:glycosyltransferase involved in cell wall biosynthesis
MRLAVLNLVPTPYREPVYQALSETPGLTLRVLYAQSRDSLRAWNALAGRYDRVQLRCLTPEFLYAVPLIGLINFGLTGHLRRFAPDCLLIYGYSYGTQLLAMRWAIRRRVPYLLWGDSNAQTLAVAGPARTLKDTLLRYFCRHAAGALTIGTENEQFWSHYGIQPERQFRSPLAVDNRFFAAEASRVRRQKALHRQRLGLPPDRLLLWVGRLARHKNVAAVLQAAAALRRSGEASSLAIALVGDGPEKHRLQQLARRLDLPAVFWFGFRSLEELPLFYGVADAFVLPSLYEPWGLVVNEAMASGLPVLVSRTAGCRPDLVEEGGNGLLFDPSSVDSIARCLRAFARLGDEQLAAMGERSARRISGWDYEAAVAGFRRALEAVAARSRAAA